MRSAFAVEEMPWLSGASVLAPVRLFAGTDVGANLVAAGNLLFGSSDRFFLIFRHFHGSLSSARGNQIEHKVILLTLAVMGRPTFLPLTTSPQRRSVKRTTYKGRESKARGRSVLRLAVRPATVESRREAALRHPDLPVKQVLIEAGAKK
jgi:hypothetical protein